MSINFFIILQRFPPDVSLWMNRRRLHPVMTSRLWKSQFETWKSPQSRAWTIVLRVRIFQPGDGNWTARDWKKFWKLTNSKFESEKFDLVLSFRQGKNYFHVTSLKIYFAVGRKFQGRQPFWALTLRPKLNLAIKVEILLETKFYLG